MSAATRERIVAAARELGWSPSLAARSLARGPQVHAIGLAITPERVGTSLDAVHTALIGGIESALAERSCALLLRITAGPEAEAALHRQWWQSGQVNSSASVMRSIWLGIRPSVGRRSSAPMLARP